MKGAHSPAPWVACVGEDSTINAVAKDGKPFRYFPHVHLGTPDHERKYIGADGQEYEARSAYIVINEGGSLEICDANALLISAAPDGLALARQVMATLDPLGRWNTEKTIATLRNAALTLIQKATVKP
jgi:hypothetical protein